MKPIYLDYNATSPMHPEVREAMLPYFGEVFGNPSSQHQFGSRARKALEESREQIAAILKAKPEEIVFTSGGTEANNMAIKGVLLQQIQETRHPVHVIVSPVEHDSVLKVIEALSAGGAVEVSQLEVSNEGEMHPDEDEFLSGEVETFGNLLKKVQTGKIHDSKTIIAILACAQYL